jgi:hypothetical protein
MFIYIWISAHIDIFLSFSIYMGYRVLRCITGIFGGTHSSQSLQPINFQRIHRFSTHSSQQIFSNPQLNQTHPEFFPPRRMGWNTKSKLIIWFMNIQMVNDFRGVTARTTFLCVSPSLAFVPRTQWLLNWERGMVNEVTKQKQKRGYFGNSPLSHLNVLIYQLCRVLIISGVIMVCQFIWIIFLRNLGRTRHILISLEQWWYKYCVRLHYPI